MKLLLFFLLLAPIFLYQLEDIIYYRLFIFKHQQAAASRLLTALPLVLIFLLLVTEANDSKATSLALGTAIFICILYIQKRHIASYTLEAQYMCLSVITLTIFTQDNWWATCFASMNFLTSSISAGVAKKSDTLWQSKTSTALKQFFTLPRLIRPIVRNTINRYTRKNNPGLDPLLKISSIILPFAQITSAAKSSDHRMARGPKSRLLQPQCGSQS